MATMATNPPVARGRKRVVKIQSSTKPKDGTSSSPVPHADIFANHRLVESPRRIQFERTQLHLQTELSAALEHFHEDVVTVPDDRLKKTRKRADDLVAYILPKVAKHAKQSGLKVLKTVKFAGSAFDDTQVISAGEVDVLVQFDCNTHKLESMEAGYYLLPLKRFKEKAGETPDPHRYGRSEDGIHLSSLAVAKLVHELIDRALKLHPSANLEPFGTEEGKAQITVTVKGKYKVNFIPATTVDKEDFQLVSQPYRYDPYAESDILWRVSYTDKEQRILDSIDMADRGVRRKAFKILKALVQMEHTLTGLTSYQIKTVLFQAFDCTVDERRRWHRESLDGAFLCLLEELHHSLKASSVLPHFFVNELNLLAHMEPRRLQALQGRVAHLLSNQAMLVRMLHKHSHSKQQETDEAENNVTPTLSKQETGNSLVNGDTESSVE